MSFFVLFLLRLPVAYALEQIANGSFANAIGTEWAPITPGEQNNALEYFDRYAVAGQGDGDDASFRSYYDYKGDPAGFFYYADGDLYQAIPAVARASDTNALIKVSYREWVDTNGNDWKLNLTGSLRRHDTPTINLGNFLTVERSGANDLPANWVRHQTGVLSLPGGYRYRLNFYFNLGLRKNIKMDLRVDKISCNISPSGLIASETISGGCFLNWADSSSAAATFSAYRVYRSTMSSSGPWTQIATIATSISDSYYADPVPPVAETVYYTVTDVDSNGNESPMAPSAVFKTARLVITAVESGPTTVTIGQMGVPVKVFVTNTGSSAARLDELDLFFTAPAIGTYNKARQTGLPIELNGGQSTTINFTLDVLAGSIPDIDTINAAATGTNLQVTNPVPRIISATEALQAHSWLIRSPANLVVQKITTPTTVYRDQKNVEVQVEVINDGNKNAAAYLDTTTFKFSGGSYENIRLADSLPVPVYPGVPVTVRYLFDISAYSATGTFVVDADIEFRDVNLLTPSANFDGAAIPGLWTVVAGVMKTFKGPPKFPAFTIEADSFNVGANIVYARTENLLPITEQRFRWYNPSGTLVRVTDPPPTTDANGVMTDQYSLNAGSPQGTWRVIATRVTNDIPLAENTFKVVTPAAISIIHEMPSFVTVSQNFIATTTIINSGGAAVDDAYCTALTTAAGITGAANLISGPEPDTSKINGNSQVKFNWVYNATAVGSFTVRGAGFGYDLNDSTFLTAATQTSNMCIIQTAPVLSVEAIVENYTNVYRNQTNIEVQVGIKNSGQAAVFVDSASLSFGNGSHNQSVASPAVLPFYLAGNSAATFTLLVAVGSESATGWVNVTASFVAHEANNPSSFPSVTPRTTNNAWNILAASGMCSANNEYSPEQYVFTRLQTIYVKFTGLTPGAIHTVFVHQPDGTLATQSGAISATAAGVFTHSYPVVAGAPLGKWRLVIRTTKSNGAIDPANNIQAEQYYIVQAPGQLTAQLNISPAPVELGKNITVTMTLSNLVASSSTIQPATPSLPLRPLTGYSGAASLVSGPDPASASVSYGYPATFTWIFQTTAFTNIGEKFALIATATGVDLNTTSLSTQRTVSTLSPISSGIDILSREVKIQPDPIVTGVIKCGDSVSVPIQVRNEGNTHLQRLIWNKDYPISPDGNKIPYEFFYFSPGSSFAIATGTAVTNGSFTLRVPYNQPPGTYTAIMTIFDDLTGNGTFNPEEPTDDFAVTVVASECQVVYTDTEQVELGGYPINSNTATATLTILNGGNLNLEKLKFALIDKTFVNSVIKILPDPLGLLATDAVALVEISAQIGSDAAGEHIATFTVYEDRDDSGAPNMGEASANFRVRFSVGGKNFTINPSPLDLGNGTPTMTLTDFNITITNTGDLPIVNPAGRVNDLTQGSYSIAKDFVTLLPPGPLAPGETKIGTISLYIPAGTPTGIFSGLQYIYDDENFDGEPSGTANEAEKSFELKVTVNPYYLIQVIPESVSLQGIAPGEPPTTISFLCRNAGNVPLNQLSWTKTPMTSMLGDTITEDRYDFSPTSTFSANFGQTFNANVTIGLPIGQAHGYYTGEFGWLYNDSAIASTSDLFTIFCQVGSKSLDIIETGPLVVSGSPNSTTPLVTFRVKNTGSLVLAKPRSIVVGNLSDGIETISGTSLTFTPATLDPLAANPGQTRTGQWSAVIPAGQKIGTYTGIMRTWDDANNSFIPDTTEASDTVGVEVRVTGKRVLSISPNPADFFFVPAGQSATLTLNLKNTGNIPVNIPDVAEAIKVKAFPLNPVSPDLPSIPETRLLFTPTPLATSLGVNQSVPITVSISVPAGQTTGPYAGNQTIFIDHAPGNNSPDAGEESVTLQVKVNVNQKKLSITSTVSLGSGNPGIPGQPSTRNATFEAKNLTSIPLSKLKWQAQPLISGANSIPVSAFSFTPTGPFSISSGGTKAVAASLSIPVYQLAGTYSSLQTLFEDENNNGSVDAGEASATFVLSVSVNTFPRIEILPSIADLGDVKPGESTLPFDLTINNIGNVDIASLDTKWALANLAGPGTIDSSLISFSAIPDPLVVGASTICQVTVGPVDSSQAAGLHTGVQTLEGQTCELQLNVLSSAIGPDLASGSLYQEIATTSFSALAPETVIFSAFVAATGTAAIGFLETLADKTTASYREVSFDFLNKTLSQSGPGIIDTGAVNIAQQNDHTWYRLYITFDYQFVESSASHTFIVLKNATPDATVALASYSVLFDGIQLEKAVIPGQTKPTAYGAKGKLISPSEGTSLDGKTQYYEW